MSNDYLQTMAADDTPPYPDAGGGPPPVPRLRLAHLVGSLQGRTSDLEPGQTYKVGRHPECPVRFDHTIDFLVSTRHGQLSVEDGRWTFVDTNSTNGSYVDGQRVYQRHVLAAGQTLILGTPNAAGSAAFRVELLAPPAAATPPQYPPPPSGMLGGTGGLPPAGLPSAGPPSAPPPIGMSDETLPEIDVPFAQEPPDSQELVRFACAHCGAANTARSAEAGRSVTCPACGRPTRVPPTSSPFHGSAVGANGGAAMAAPPPPPPPPIDDEHDDAGPPSYAPPPMSSSPPAAAPAPAASSPAGLPPPPPPYEPPPYEPPPSYDAPAVDDVPPAPSPLSAPAPEPEPVADPYPAAASRPSPQPSAYVPPAPAASPTPAPASHPSPAGLAPHVSSLPPAPPAEQGFFGGLVSGVKGKINRMREKGELKKEIIALEQQLPRMESEARAACTALGQDLWKADPAAFATFRAGPALAAADAAAETFEKQVAAADAELADNASEYNDWFAGWKDRQDAAEKELAAADEALAVARGHEQEARDAVTAAVAPKAAAMSALEMKLAELVTEAKLEPQDDFAARLKALAESLPAAATELSDEVPNWSDLIAARAAAATAVESAKSARDAVAATVEENRAEREQFDAAHAEAQADYQKQVSALRAEIEKVRSPLGPQHMDLGRQYIDTPDAPSLPTPPSTLADARAAVERWGQQYAVVAQKRQRLTELESM